MLVIAGVAAWLLVLAHESRRAAEEETRRQTALLLDEIEAHQRTDAALQKAKEAAEAANLAKSRYVVGISHELRTPAQRHPRLCAASGARRRHPGAASASGLRIIRRSAEHLTGLIDGLLDISRIEAGRSSSTATRCRCREFLDQIVDMFRLQAEAKGIEFRYRGRGPAGRGPYRREAAAADADQPALQRHQVHRSGQRRPSASAIAARSRSSSRRHRPRHRRQTTSTRIFEPFRARGRRAVAVPGTGLGLTIIQLLTEVMGGEITVDAASSARAAVSACGCMLSEAAETLRPSPPRWKSAAIAGGAVPCWSPMTIRRTAA